jgi:hypothetical protein
MKLIKSALRIWITLTTVVGFFAGWAVLAHSPKPQPYVKPNRSVLGLAPVPALLDLVGDNVRSSGPRVLSPSRAFSPRFRTAGS